MPQINTMNRAEHEGQNEIPDDSSEESGMALHRTTVLKCHSTKNPHSKEQTIHIVGTAHVSKKSCQLVREVIRAVRPQVTMLYPNQRALFTQRGYF